MQMLNAAIYDKTTGQVTATATVGHVDALAHAGDWVEIPPGVDIDDPSAWRVDLTTYTLIHAGRAPTPAEINAERDRRIAENFTFQGAPFDFDPLAKSNITGAASLAGFASAAGAGVGNTKWHGGVNDFTWLTRDNNLVAMDAPTVFAFGQAGAAHVSEHIFAARAIKDADPVPQDYTADTHWPGAET